MYGLRTMTAVNALVSTWGGISPSFRGRVVAPRPHTTCCGSVRGIRLEAPQYVVCASPMTGPERIKQLDTGICNECGHVRTINGDGVCFECYLMEHNEELVARLSIDERQALKF